VNATSYILTISNKDVKLNKALGRGVERRMGLNAKVA
jgi:hypothetical protein